MRRRITEDGLESQFATNYFGPFLLTNILMPLMESTGNARIVLISSEMHRLGTDLDLNNLNAEIKWIGKKIYPWNKLCQVLFMRELHRKLRDADSTIAINSLHPGAVRTEIFNTAKGPVQFLANAFWWFFKSPWEGAQTPLYLSVSEEVEGVSGFYWTECKKTMPSSIIKDKELSRKLWDISVQLVKLEQKDNPVIKI